LNEESARIAFAIAWSAGRVPGEGEDFLVVIFIHLTASFRRYLIELRLARYLYVLTCVYRFDSI